jgi:hypothetical protein
MISIIGYPSIAARISLSLTLSSNYRPAFSRTLRGSHRVASRSSTSARRKVEREIARIQARTVVIGCSTETGSDAGQDG